MTARSTGTACALALLAACGGGGTPPGSPAPALPGAPGIAEKQVVVAQDGVAGRATIAQDELLVVELEARPSTGTTWQVDALDAAVLAFVRREHVSAPVTGGVDLERLVFQGVAAGTAAVSLSYRRPWLPATADDPVFRVDVVVRGPYTGPIAAAAPRRSLAYVPNLAAGLASRYDACDPGDGSYSRCTPPKDQGPSGACWAFATAGVFENLLQLANPSKRYDLSEQYLVSCNRDGFSAADGGNVAFHLYVDAFVSPPENAAGAVYESDFPWQARDVPCGSRAHPHHEKLTRFKQLQGPVPSVDTIKQAIVAHGPVFAAVCADNAMASWDGRSIFRHSCDEPNHAIVLVGWDDNGGDGYWILRNSWGADWGDRGYMKIAYGASQVGFDLAWAEYAAPAPNQPPVADAGRAQTVGPRATVTLDGSASRDPDGRIARYAWSQTGGTPAVTLSGAASATPTFVAPGVAAGARLTFALTVTDDAGATGTATVSVDVTADASASTDTTGTSSGGSSGASSSGASSSGAGTGPAPTPGPSPGSTASGGPASGGTVVGGCSSAPGSGPGAGTLALLAVAAARRRWRGR